jgi:hypothetical protein
MSEFLWSWKKGNTQIYVRNFNAAEQAMNEGFYVTVLQIKSHIYNKQHT